MTAKEEYKNIGRRKRKQKRKRKVGESLEMASKFLTP